MKRDVQASVEPPLWQQRPFRMLSYTRFWSRVAQNALNFGLVLLITEETGRAVFTSLLVLALVVPSTFAGIVAGTAADVLPKRLIVVLADIARSAICIGFLLQGGGAVSYYLFAVLLATTSQFAGTAESAILPAIVRRDDLARANAIGQAVGGAAQAIGLGVVTPVVLRLVDSRDALFALCAGLFAVAAVQAALIGSTASPERKEVGGEPGGAWWSAGWRAMRADRAVLHAALELTLISAAVIILSGLIPSYITDVLGVRVDFGAAVLFPAVLGVALGLRVAGFLARRVPHSLLSSTGFLMFVVSLGLLAIVNELSAFLGGFGIFAWLNSVSIGRFDGGGVIAMAVMLPLGFAYALVSVAGQTVIDDRVPLSLRGRVGATQAAMAAMASSIPVVVAGVLSDWVGVGPVFGLVAVVTGIVAIANRRSGQAADRRPRVIATGGH
ncbi:MAG: MFS transporter [Tepidiforma sp.]|nr:MAG: MFS transporter [Tepidiforma sp.]